MSGAYDAPMAEVETVWRVACESCEAEGRVLESLSPFYEGTDEETARGTLGRLSTNGHRLVLRRSERVWVTVEVREDGRRDG